MKYLVSYECRSNGEVSSGEFEFESARAPEITDTDLINKATQECEDFKKSIVNGLSITSISLLS